MRRITFATITTVAGSGAAEPAREATPAPGDGGPATDAQLNDPNGVSVDAAGAILVADSLNDRIRRVSPDGTMTTIAGGGFRAVLDDDGVPATEVVLSFPTHVAVDADGTFYIAETGNHRIRRVDLDGTITTVAGSAFGSAGFAGDGGPATDALLNFPVGVAVGHRGELLIADTKNNRIRRVGPRGKISTVAGTGVPFFAGDGGPATDALLNFPTEVLLDGTEHLLIADSSNARVRMVDRDGVITTIAGGGGEPPADGLPATSVSLISPTGMAFDREGRLLVCEETAHRVWRLTPVAS